MSFGARVGVIYEGGRGGGEVVKTDSERRLL
jgi:hypothetical protein